MNDELSPPDFNEHVIKEIPIEYLWKYVNIKMLYGKHLGVKGKHLQDIENQEIYQQVEEVKELYKDIFNPIAIYRFFKVKSLKDSIIFLKNGDRKELKIEFPRQNKTDGVCLSDFIDPYIDNMALMVVTAGSQALMKAKQLKNSGEYVKSHILNSLTLEIAEATAEFVHRKIKALWGLDENATQGERFSFGYPACPNIEGQQDIFKLLTPSKIQVSLTNGFMLSPEASITALVFYNKNAHYFSAKAL